MAVPVNSWTNVVGRLAPRLSETLLVSGTNNSILETAGLRRMSTVLRRPKTANPSGWSRKRVNVSKTVPFDKQETGSSPSSVYLKSMKNGPRPPTSSSERVKMNLYDRFLQNCSPKTGIAKQPSENVILPISTVEKKTQKKMDREDEMFYVTDQASSKNGNQPKKQAAKMSESLEKNAIDKEYEANSANDSTCSENISSPVNGEGYITFEKENIHTSSENVNPRNKFSRHKKEVIEFEKGNESQEYLSEAKESEVKGNVLSGSDPISQPTIRNTDWATSSQRSVDINLNDWDRAKSEDKKSLSMDINVIVSVKPQDNIQKPEIGFQELQEHKEEKDMTVQIYNEKSEKLHINRETRYLSQKDLTEEIGRVYNFLKYNEKIQTAVVGNNPNSLDAFQNFEKIKDLYFNALKCVKAYKALTSNMAENVNSGKKDLPGHPLLGNEIEKCCKTDSADSSREFNLYKYPIDLYKNDEGSSRQYTQSLSAVAPGKQLLTGKPPRLTNVRFYSSDSGTSKTDCVKAKKLPCLQSSELSSQKEPPASGRSVCDKLCMPCCKPARDPPLCFYPYHKPPCKKEKPPRPAFSECKQLFELRQVVPCECVKPRATSCKKSPESESCAKR